ncbi:MAG: substrate-binding domain-containing protein, partial [Bacteroidota bacterium]
EGDLFITITESDLVNLVKLIRDSDFRMGENIGVISYNETPLKDLLGITTVSTDFAQMGETAAEMILEKRTDTVKNAFHFTERESL